MAFEVTRRVRFADVDPAGIVFYPRYFEMINATVEDWFEHGLGYGFRQLITEDGFGVPTANIEADFKVPSKLDDTLVFTLTVRDLGRSSIKLRVNAHCGEELRMTARPTIVYISAEENKPIRIPDGLRTRMLEFQETG